MPYLQNQQSPPLTRDVPPPTSGLTGGLGTVIHNTTANASSLGAGGFGMVPSIPPDQVGRITGALSSLIYKPDAGGYIFAGPDQNANSYYTKFGTSNPAANKLAASIYGEIGNYPQVPLGTPALAKLTGGATTGVGLTPIPGGTPGPSINQMLSNFGSTYGGDASRYGFGVPYQGPYLINPQPGSYLGRNPGWSGY